MSLIVLEHAHLAFGGREIFGGVNLRIAEGENIGLIGPNGAGKSTLFRVLLGQQALDGGDVRPARSVRLGYLPQDVLEVAGDTLLRSVLDTVPGRADLEATIEQAEKELAQASEPEVQIELAGRLSELVDRHEHFEVHYSERQAMRILLGLGFRESDLQRPTAEFSGGWKMRAALAGLLFQQPDVLFLDEPTNHLDIPSVLWLDNFLRDYRSAVVLISHDRDFLNRHARRILSFEPEGLRSYKGNYEDYLRQRALEEEVLDAKQRNQQRELKELERFVERFKAKATKARQAQSRARRVKRLQQEMEAQKPMARGRTLSFSFPEVARSGKDVLTLENISKAFGTLELYRNARGGVFAADRIAIIGVNGAGKTTLLKIMARELDPDAGHVTYGANVELGYYSQHHTELLSHQNTVLDEVRRIVPSASESYVRGVCGAFLFSGDDVDKAIGVLSGGERARVLLARLLVKPGNLLLMDEPTNHLDLASAEALADALEMFGGTLVFVSHNTTFVNRLATKVWDISDGQIVEYPGNLQEYLEHKARWQAEQAAKTAPDQATKSTATKEVVSGRTPSKRAPGPAPTPAETLTQKERKAKRRQQAEQRNELARKTKSVKRAIGELEGRIAALEGEQKAVEPQMADPELYQDKERFQALLDRFNQNREKIEELYARWEAKQSELEQIEASHSPSPEGLASQASDRS